MIIQCEQCRTRFRLDDSKIRENGVKVRCAKCRHVFTIRKEQTAETEQSSFAAVLQQSPGFSEAAPSESPGPDQETVSPEFQPEQPVEDSFATAPEKPESSPVFDFNAFEPAQEETQAEKPFTDEFAFPAMASDSQQEITPPLQEASPPPPGEFDFSEVDFGLPTEQQPAAAVAGEQFPAEARLAPEQPLPPIGDEFAFPARDDQQDTAPSIPETPPSPHGEIDFGDLDFGLPAEQQPAAAVAGEQFPAEESLAPEQPLPPIGDEFVFPALDDQQETAPPIPETPPSPHGEIDFGDLDFGLPAEQQPAAAIAGERFPVEASLAPEHALPPLEFEFELPDSAAATQAKLDTEPGATVPAGAKTTTLVDEFDFGMALPTPSSQQEQPKPEEVFTFGAPEEAATTPPQPGVASPSPGLPVQPEPELKPFGPTLFEAPEPGSADSGLTQPEPDQEGLPPLTIPSRRKSSSMLKVLLTLLVVAIVAAAAFYGKDLYPKLKQIIAPQSGTILLRSVTSSFVKNTTTGSELLVISGEAVNGFTTPRASLQVRGMVYGDKDQVLISKNVFCGNPLSPEQLASMPLDAIELAMANQVGSGLSNLEVAPGKALPFTVVIARVPEGAKNIGVVPAGSQALGDKPK